MPSEEEQAAEEYRGSLNELNSISKPEINALTMLAEDNKQYAVNIASCIENHLKTVPKDRKLPVLYLIDSICKNYPLSIYVQLFTQNIVSNFCNVFEVSNEKVRKSLHKLRMTWNATKIFPEKKLNAIDERVHEMDPNWPILHMITSQQRQQPAPQQQAQQPSQDNNKLLTTTKTQSQPPPVQQQQLQQQQQQARLQARSNSQVAPGQEVTNTNNNNNINAKRANNQTNGRRKRAKTNRNNNNQLQQQQVLIQQQQQQQQQQMQLQQTSEPVMVPPPQTFIDPQFMRTPHDLPHVHPTTFMDPSITIGPKDPLHQVPTAAYLDTSLIIAPNEPQIPAQQLLCTTPFSQPVLGQIPPPQQQQQQQPLPPLPPQQQSQHDLNPAHLTVLESLYGGKQCSNCSLRFDDNNRYAIHLDWHFRQKSERLKSDNMFARRKWYYPLNLWVQFREIDDDLQDNNNTESNNINDSLLPVNEHEAPTAPASKDDEKNICSVCHESFEKFWAEEEEEWRLKNAKLFEDERVYHPLCLIDMVQANVKEVNAYG